MICRVLLVDDQEMIRLGLRAIIDSSPDFAVVAEASDGFEALRVLDHESVDLIVMDVRMPGIDGVETTRRVRATRSAQQLPIIVLTTFEEDAVVLDALQAGANGFLGKGVGPAALLERLRQTVQGDAVLSPAASSAVVEHVQTGPRRPVDAELAQRFAALTPRELDVVIAVAAGNDNEQIAAAMFVSPFTIKTHATRAMAKVAARDRAQLVAFAYRAGLV
ncbi:LuxR family two component transcriptional regulator [Curtobacterium sp. PhB130]|uniref:response regulator transcription factor n=1 Tax=Curtobacterium sp. PhB130 TaxID=2485178 RepID=UPI000FB5A58C|nr:response regulator transcription factor [Curtobacterium sp. PhB130]ROS76085.1 LuxR family two component transcriptional regulator [Curtobacterium sp. PhB130]